VQEQALHATLLCLDHPGTARPLRFLAPLPPDLRRAVLLLRAAAPPDAPAVPGAAVDLAAAGL
jgi:hypothetical protein